MGTNYNPRIATEGLKTYIDAGLSRCFTPWVNETIYSTWKVGASPPAWYAFNGTASENSFEFDTDPWGQSNLVWKAIDNDLASNADGGWAGYTFPVDQTKLYRFSVWMRRKVNAGGRHYWGLYAYTNLIGNNGVYFRSNGTTLATNAYFYSGISDVIGTNNSDWFLVVAHVWPEGSGAGSAHDDTGIWSTSGVKNSGPSDFIWKDGTVRASHRSYLYYSVDPTDYHQWIYPRIEVVDGTEPSIADLIANKPNTITDRLSAATSVALNGIDYQTNGWVLDGVDDYIRMPDSGLSTTHDASWGVEAWIRPTSASDGIIACPQTYGLDSALLRASDGHITLWVCEYGDTNNRVRTTTGVTSLGQWSHVAASYDGDYTRVWLNGNLEVEQAETIPVAPWGGEWQIGQRGNGTYHFGGQIGAIRAYDRALVSDEVQQNMAATRGRYNVPIVLDGLLANYDAGDARSYPGAGNVWYDLAGNSDLTFVNTPPWDSQGWFTFNGSSHYGTGPGMFNEDAACTIGMWVSRTATNSQFSVYVGESTNGPRAELVWYTNSYLYGEVGIADSHWVRAYPSYYADTNWHYMAFTFDGSGVLNADKITLYRDDYPMQYGGTSGTIDATIPAAATQLRIGHRSTGYSAGKLGAVHIYNRALSREEITQNWVALRGRFGV